MFQGSIVALITPMDDRGAIDFDALQRLVDWHLEAGTDGIVVAGTTGESATLEGDEFERLLAAVLERVDGRIPVLAGTGGAATAKTVKQTRLAETLGASGALVVTPYYVRPTQAGLEAHYRAIASATSLPLVLYNVPSRTGVDLLPGTVAALADLENVVAIKEAKSDMDRVAELVERCGQRMTVLSGDDPSCREAMRRGARGVISVAANVAPDRMHSVCAAAISGADAEADRLDEELKPLYEAMALETNPIPAKWSVHLLGRCGPGIRLPLQPLAEQYRPALERVLAGLAPTERTGTE